MSPFPWSSSYPIFLSRQKYSSFSYSHCMSHTHTSTITHITSYCIYMFVYLPKLWGPQMLSFIVSGPSTVPCRDGTQKTYVECEWEIRECESHLTEKRNLWAPTEPPHKWHTFCHHSHAPTMRVEMVTSSYSTARALQRPPYHFWWEIKYESSATLTPSQSPTFLLAVPKQEGPPHWKVGHPSLPRTKRESRKPWRPRLSKLSKITGNE